MVRLAGIPVANKTSIFGSGVALLLEQERQIDEVLSVDADWEAEVQSDGPYIVARGRSAGTNAAETFAAGYEAAQKGLDLLSLTGKADLSIRDAMNESLVWWRADGAQVLRVISAVRMGVSITAEAEVRDRFGSLRGCLRRVRIGDQELLRWCEKARNCCESGPA